MKCYGFSRQWTGARSIAGSWRERFLTSDCYCHGLPSAYLSLVIGRPVQQNRGTLESSHYRVRIQHLAIDKPEHSGLRLVLEGAVVVLSILVAFALDAGWDEAALRRDVLLDLGNVERELSVNRDMVLFQQDLMTRMLVGSESLVEIMAANPDRALINVADTLAWLQFLTPTFDPSLGATDALIASGRMASIEDPDLRLELAGIRGLIRDAVEDQVVGRDVYYDLLAPAVYAASDSEKTVRVATTYWAEERAVGRALSSYGEVPYPNTPFVRNAIRERALIYRIAVTELDSVLEAIDRIEELIAASR